MDSKLLSKKTKIVATVGPASSSTSVLTDLIGAGVDVFRLNFSHGDYEEHEKIIRYVREINEEKNLNISLLQDLQGPKIRTQEIENGNVMLDEGQELTIVCDDILGNKERIGTSYKELAKDVKVDDTILIDDGKIELIVTGKKRDNVKTRVIHGGILKSRKGINLPNTIVSAPSLTEKDERDLEFGLKHEVDWVALSFVRKAKDVLTLKNKIRDSGKIIKVVAKIEKPEAIKNIDEIIEATNAVMVARGDLGVEIAMEDVPMVQKELVSKCNRANRPVIIATQMMESMIENPRPTRAETNDIANAVLDGADAIMLSGETATGKYPLLAVQSMSKTILAVEKDPKIYNKFYELKRQSDSFLNDDLVATACRLCKETQAKAIIGMTKSGYTAYRISQHRPRSSIYVFTANKNLLTIMNLIWGVKGFFYDKMKGTDQTFAELEEFLKKKKLLKKGDIFVTTAGMPLHWKTHTNMLKIKAAE